YGFLPQKNFFVLDEGGLAWELNDKFILSKLEIEKDFPKKLTIYVREKVSLLNLCVGESCYKVDYFGNIGGRADINNLEEGTPLVYYRLEEEEETEEEPAEDEVEETGEGIVDEIESNPQVKNFPKVIPGATTLSDAKARALIDLFELLREESGGLGIESMDIYSFDGLTERITVNFKGGYKVFFSDEKDLNKQVSDLNTVINNEIRSKTSDIEYIDLRFDKIYYK
ncbi:hypothetical protein HQ544_01175, partial [Candidatus Falkowbacteria bacterium]|nr:hypothetical protein [Candidatus Falkowbacteria bacterium]